MAKRGRPTDYTPELGDKICALLADGTSLKKITDESSMPSRQTVYSWLRLHEDFLDNYTRAKDDSADSFADNIVVLIEETKAGKLDPHRARVALDGYKWTASKLKPKKYGDKLDITGEQTFNHKFKDMDDTEIDAAIAAAAKNLPA